MTSGEDEARARARDEVLCAAIGKDASAAVDTIVRLHIDYLAKEPDPQMGALVAWRLADIAGHLFAHAIKITEAAGISTAESREIIGKAFNDRVAFDREPGEVLQ